MIAARLASFILVSAITARLFAAPDIFDVHDGKAYALQDPYSDNAAVVRSSDGQTWETLFTAREGIMKATVLPGALFVETEEKTIRYDLANGETTPVPDTFAEGIPYFAHGYYFFHDSRHTLYRSEDGIDWQPFHRITDTEGVAYYLYAATDGAGNWVIAGNTDSPYSVHPYLAFSQDDGKSWSREYQIMLEETDFTHLFHDGEKFILVANSVYYTSKDGSQWDLEYTGNRIGDSFQHYSDGTYYFRRSGKILVASTLNAPEKDWQAIELPEKTGYLDFHFDQGKNKPIFSYTVAGDQSYTRKLFDPTSQNPVDLFAQGFAEPVADSTYRPKLLPPNSALQNAYPQTGQILADWDAAWTAASNLEAQIALTQNALLELEKNTQPKSENLKTAVAFLAQRLRLYISPPEFYKALNKVSVDTANAVIDSLEPNDEAVVRAYAGDISKKYNNPNYVAPERKWTYYKTRPVEPAKYDSLTLGTLRKRLFQGHVGAVYDLFYAYNTGDGTPIDKDAAFFWSLQAKRLGLPIDPIPEDDAGKRAYYQRFADAGSIKFNGWLLDLLIAKAENKALPNPEIRERLQFLVDQSYTPYYKTAAIAHRSAYYGFSDLLEARRLLEYHATQEDSHALTELAIVEIMLAHLGGQHQWPAETSQRVLSLLQRASNANNNFATRLIGQLHELGIGTPANSQTAREFYQKALDAGYEFAAKDIKRLDGDVDASTPFFTTEPVNEPRFLPLSTQLASRLPQLAAIHCVDLHLVFKNGTGFRKDAFLRDYFANRTAAAEFEYPEWIGSSTEERLAYWSQLSEQGSVFGAAESGFQAAKLDDDALTARYFKLAADRGSPYGNVRYAELQLAGTGTKADPADARNRLQMFASTYPYAAETLAAIEAGNWKMPAYKPAAIVKKRLPPEYDLAARQAAAEAGDQGALYDMLYAYFNARGYDYNQEQTDAWRQRLAATGFVFPEWGDDKAGNHLFWEAVAQTGSLSARWEYVSNLLDGDGVEKDHPTATPLLRTLAEDGSYKAQYFLGKALRYGWWGLEKDAAEATQWLEKAIAGEDEDAEFELAGILYNAAANEDKLRSLKLYEQAAAKGKRLAVIMAADMLSRGSPYPVKQDKLRGASWLLHYAGLPSQTNSAFKAIKQIEAAALARNPQAIEAYAYALVTGFEIEEQDNEGLAWYKAMKLDPELEEQLSQNAAYSWFKSKAPKLGEAEDAAREATLEARAQQIVAALQTTPFALADFSPVAYKAPTENQFQSLAAIELLKNLSSKLWSAAKTSLGNTNLTSHPLYPKSLETILDSAANTPSQHWLADLAQIAAPATDSAAAEKALTPLLIGSATPGTPEFNQQQALRSLVALRLYYGVDRPSDKPAAAAWLLLRAGGDEYDTAYQFVIATLTPEQKTAAQNLYQRIVSFIKGPLPPQAEPIDALADYQDS